MNSLIELINNFKIEFLENTLSQTFWLIAYAITFFSFIFLKDKKLIFWNLVNSFFWWLHYQLLWQAIAAFINYFDVLKNLFALKFEKKKQFFYFFFFSYLIIWLITFDEIYSIFPFLAVLFSSYLVFFVRWIKLKLWFLLVLLLWLIYNISVFSIGWIFSDTTLILALIIWIIKDYFINKKEWI